AKPITLNGTGFAFNGQVGNLGALNASASAVITGSVFINPGATIGVASAQTLTVTGILSDGPLGSGALFKTGAASAAAGTIVLANANTYSGSTTINSGGITFSGAGSALSTTGVTINQGGSLTLDNTSGNVNVFNRLNAGVPINLSSGTLTFIGNN